MTNDKCQMSNDIQGVFFNWPPPEFAKCRPVSNQFEKIVRVQDWPPLCDCKKLKCSDWPPLYKLKSLDWEGTGSVLRTFSIWGGQSQNLHWHSILSQFRGGPVEAILGGGQSREIFGGGPVKKNTLYFRSHSGMRLPKM